jgi:hypothetical protein
LCSVIYQFLEVCVQHYKPDYLIGHSIGGATCVFHQRNIKYLYYENGLARQQELQIIFENYAQLIRSLSKKEPKRVLWIFLKINFK